MEGANYFYIDFNFSIWSVSVSCIVFPREMFVVLLPISRCCCYCQCCSFCCRPATTTSIVTVQLNFSVWELCAFFPLPVGVEFVADDAMLLRRKSFSLRYDIVNKFHRTFWAQTLFIFSFVRKSFQVNWFKRSVRSRCARYQPRDVHSSSSLLASSRCISVLIP